MNLILSSHTLQLGKGAQRWSTLAQTLSKSQKYSDHRALLSLLLSLWSF